MRSRAIRIKQWQSLHQPVPQQRKHNINSHTLRYRNPRSGEMRELRLLPAGERRLTTGRDSRRSFAQAVTSALTQIAASPRLPSYPISPWSNLVIPNETLSPRAQCKRKRLWTVRLRRPGAPTTGPLSKSLRVVRRRRSSAALGPPLEPLAASS